MTRISGIGLDSSLIITNTIFSLAGQLLVGTGPGTAGILNPGADGQILSVDTSVSPYKLKWINPPTSGGTGDVVGPASSVDRNIACFDGTTGKLLLDSGVSIDSSSNLTTTGSVTAGSFSTAGSASVGSLTSAGAVTITSGGLTVSAGGATITGNSSVTGTLSVSSSLSAAGFTNSSFVVNNYVTTGATPYVASATDYYISVPTSSAVTVQLPNAPTTGRCFVIKDKTGNAATNNITVRTVNGTVQIDGSTTFAIDANYGSISVIFNGTSYEIF